MASNTRPFLMTGAALASAAALVVATPTIVSSTTASPLASSSAAYNLTTFADVFTIPSGEWVNALFQGYGGIVGPNNPAPSNPEETGGLEPWASGCSGGCFVFGLPAVSYLALDALINGNGEGWDNNEDWTIGALNYFYEGGPAAGTQWLVQSSVGAANPLLSVAITLLFTGPQLVTVIYDNALSLLADAALALPLVGDYVYGAINAYLGPASQDAAYQKYIGGFGGILNYAADLLSGNVEPADPAAATLASAAAVVPAAGAAAVKSAPAAPVAVVEAAPAVTATPAVVEAPAAGQDAGAPADAASLPTEAAEAAVESAPADVEADTESAPADGVADSVPAAGTEQAPAGKGAAAAGKRPVRDAVAKVTQKITSALGGGTTAAPSAGTTSATADTGSAGTAGGDAAGGASDTAG